MMCFFGLLNKISQGNPEWNRGGVRLIVKKTFGMLEVDAITALTAQIAFMQNMMNTHFRNMNLGQPQTEVNAVQHPQGWCEVCGSSEHVNDYCGANPIFGDYVGITQRGGIVKLWLH